MGACKKTSKIDILTQRQTYRNYIETEKETTKKHGDPTNNQFVVWTFQNVDADGEFAFVPSLKRFDAEMCFECMLAYSKMTWQEVINGTHDKGKSKHHYLAPQSLSKKAVDRINKKGFNDKSDSLFSFALNNKVRVIGFRNGAVFQVVWYDAEHAFTESKKKHT